MTRAQFFLSRRSPLLFPILEISQHFHKFEVFFSPPCPISVEFVNNWTCNGRRYFCRFALSFLSIVNLHSKCGDGIDGDRSALPRGCNRFVCVSQLRYIPGFFRWIPTRCFDETGRWPGRRQARRFNNGGQCRIAGKRRGLIDHLIEFNQKRCVICGGHAAFFSNSLIR